MPRFAAFRIALWLLVPLGVVVGCSGDSGDDAGGGITTESGLTITHLREGDGPQPTRNSMVVVHYHGTFPDGEVFDSSVERGEPATFPLRGVIRCWTEGLGMMKVGGKAKLVCPPELAYGEKGSPPLIPPDATLHFEVTLLSLR
ncbi:MAG: FKBP-type peptidyl-prolyl cis-trans isomerase [Myxococcota bacterium]